MKVDRAYSALDAIESSDATSVSANAQVAADHVASDHVAVDHVAADVAADRDQDLVDRAAHGDRTAFETLLRRHYELMHRISWRLTGSRTDAQDITQEVCCALVEKIGSFKGEAKFTTWLIGIVRNAC